MSELDISLVQRPPQAAPEAWFEGHVEMEAINDNVATGLRQGRVHFYDGGRTRWHLHVGDQVLYFLSGHGMVEKLGGTLIETVAGDIVHIPGGLQHRHGAQAGKSATHIAITQGETIWDNDPRYPV